MLLVLAVMPGPHLQWGVEPHSVDRGSVGRGLRPLGSVGRGWSVVDPTTCT